MDTIDLQAIPNQSVNFVEDGQQYNLSFRAIGDTMYVDIAMNGATIVTAIPCIANEPLIPYQYLEGDGGNFLFVTASGDNPQYDNFGSNDILMYVSAAELLANRGTAV
jgi:hypothetical protein